MEVTAGPVAMRAFGSLVQLGGNREPSQSALIKLENFCCLQSPLYLLFVFRKGLPPALEHLIEINLISSRSQLPAQRKPPLTVQRYVNNALEVRWLFDLLTNQSRDTVWP